MVRKNSGSGSRHRSHGPRVLFEDRDILVADKPAGLLTIATDKEKDRTAYHQLTDYVRKGNYKSPNRVFIVHRLDRETSGVLLLAKTEQAKRRLQDDWETTEKKYLAIVQGHLRKREDTITSYLAENQAHVVFSTTNPTQGKLAQTAYRVLKETKDLSLLEVTLLTGRKHQIRVHLSDLGHPLVGDRRYGQAKGPRAKLALHARSLTFTHPTTGRRLTFEAKVPNFFQQLLGEFKLEPDAQPPQEEQAIE